MASPNVSGTKEQKVPEVSGTIEITRKVENPVTGKENEVTGKGEFTLAKNLNDILALSGGREEVAVFWYNWAKRQAAYRQLTQKIEFDLGSDELNERFAQYTSTMKQLEDKDQNDDEKKAQREFILGQKKFKDLKVALDGYTGDNFTVNFDDELKMPTGVRGRQKAED